MTLTAKSRFQSSSVIDFSGAECATPALLTRMSTFAPALCSFSVACSCSDDDLRRIGDVAAHLEDLVPFGAQPLGGRRELLGRARRDDDCRAGVRQ